MRLPLRFRRQQKRRFRANKIQQGQSALAHMSDHIHPGIGGEVLPGDHHLTGVAQIPGIVHGDAAKIYPLSMAHDRMAIFRLSVYLKENILYYLYQLFLYHQ